MPKANKKKSGSQKLKEFRERQAAKSKPGQSPSQYREKIKKQKAEEQKRIQEAAKAARTGGGMQLSPMAKQIVKNNPIKYKPEQIQPLVNKITSSSSPTNPTANKKELEDIRAIMGAGFKPGASVLGELGKQYQMKQALEADLKLRDSRIDERQRILSRQEKQLNQAEQNLKSYDKYIKNGQFTGNESQYNAYKSAYDSYEKLYNRYSSNYQLQKTDVETFNKNKQSIDSKKPAKKLRKGYNKISAAYDAANLKLGSKLPTVEQVEPYIRQLVKTSTPVGMATQISDRILKRKDTEKIVQFSLGAYESVKQKPLKAAATFVTFAVGGVAVKGLSTAAKTLGAGAKTARAAKLIEGGMLGVYATSTGIKYASVDNAREAGFVTGDVIFNELLPAGLGMKLGVRVVNSIPKGATKIRGTGTKIKKQVQAEIPKKIQAEITKIKRQITTSKNKTGKGLTVKKAQELQTRLKTVENSFRQRRIKANQLRREIRKINQEFEAFERAEKAAMDNVRKATAKEIATLKNLSKKKNTGKITNMAKKLNAERDAKLKSGEYVEVKRSDGQVVLQKVKVKTKQLTATQQKQVQAQKQQIKTVQDVSTKATPKLKINGKVKQVNRMGAVSLLAVLAVAGNKLKISTRQLIKQKVGLVQKQATRQTQRQRTRQTQTQKPRQAVKQTPRQAVKTKQATRPRTRPSKKAKEKPPEIILPAIANLNLKSRRPKKKTKRSKKGITTTQALNKVATFKDLFG